MANFIDHCKISVAAGNGGNGVISFRKEAHVPRGGPDGGDGGHGGSVIFVGEEGLSTLLHLKYKRKYKAENGKNGMSKRQFGKSADNLYIKVPVGTIFKNADTGEFICDIIEHNQEVIIAKGGNGGRGNARFANSRNKAPKISENGGVGERFDIECELKILADVGLVGLPSVGKSTFISSVSNSKPKIADYHFTTLVPNIGVTKDKSGRSFVIADLPGLIEGASQGKGLGIRFLKHIERCRVLLHVVDMSAEYDQYDEFVKINKELETYDASLMKRPMIIAANKMDEGNAKENLAKFKEKCKEYEIFETSALIRESLDDILYKLANILEDNKSVLIDQINAEEKVMHYKFKKDTTTIKVEQIGIDKWEVTGIPVQRACQKIPLNSHQNIMRFNDVLKSLDVFNKLSDAGAEQGDTIYIYDHVLEMMD